LFIQLLAGKIIHEDNLLKFRSNLLTIWSRVCWSNSSELSPYLEEDTILLHYKYQLANIV
jgi:hypothetical protein